MLSKLDLWHGAEKKVSIINGEDQMSLSEADTRAKLIDPALHRRGWTEDLIRREETECGIDIIDGKPRRRKRGRTDYLLRIRVNISAQPVPIALIEAKRDDEPPDKGLSKPKKYDISIRSAQRDLRQLLEENLIVQEGLGRGVKYKKP